MLENDQNGVRTSFSLLDLSLDHKNEEDGDDIWRLFGVFLGEKVSRGMRGRERVSLSVNLYDVVGRLNDEKLFRGWSPNIWSMGWVGFGWKISREGERERVTMGREERKVCVLNFVVSYLIWSV